MCYLDEMARVLRPGGVAAFDLVTDDCLDAVVTKTWLTEPGRATIYTMAPRSWTIDFLAARGLQLLGNHFVPLSGGQTELLVFRRQ
jgi:hypothetical protein